MPAVPSPPLAGKKALVLGIANEHSIAYGCAKAFRKLGCDLAITYLNDKAKKPVGKLWLNGKLMGQIENWNLTLGWNPDAVQLVLGASYVGHMDDLAVFNRALTDAEVTVLHGLKSGVRELHP